jgi:hypothetical protein
VHLRHAQQGLDPRLFLADLADEEEGATDERRLMLRTHLVLQWYYNGVAMSLQ